MFNDLKSSRLVAGNEVMIYVPPGPQYAKLVSTGYIFNEVSVQG